MKNLFRSLETQRPSLQSGPHRYEPSLYLSKADISAMFPPEVPPTLCRRQSLVLDERRRRRSVLHQSSAMRTTKDLVSYEQYGDCLVDVRAVVTHHRHSNEPRPPAKVVLFHASQYSDDDRAEDHHRFRHSMPAQFCY
ncbi:hypothetical protein H310_01807 [Aphanomyces invadans]|uniref:Uncharacterized protein n=1 Tax=Aphanomyces invadans TaxID=157072 RepID=A0A024UNM6_9STRA|nr:hypothetical protein H310_01807 [Aphanomyces invadans]ETW07243.1 hypothetical protein H310_01807 [Aphanomyces invadans]RHY24623.1 hypothetical protein DYB32_008773 [Aphanomyces invadans]|eukprot:XP_008863336.1 hypothetical protein H310_01807 [Aphanomyces invadans]